MREPIPKKFKDMLLNEYDHRCAVCGGDRPHVHHVNEDASDNSIENLLPLCPNCHLSDQHNPTRKIDIPKLQLFRKYKDPSILKPQFHPIYTRQLFLDEVVLSDGSVDIIESQVKELIEFVGVLEMGAFYSKRLTELVGPLKRAIIMNFNANPDENYNRQVLSKNSDYRSKIVSNRENAIALLIELLRYQDWANS